MDLAQMLPTAHPKSRPADAALGFGEVFTDHMLLADYHADTGWGPPRLAPYAPLRLDPAAGVLHYGQAVFEGLKAYRGDDGFLRLFRPLRHLTRLERSADRLCMPAPDPEAALVWLRSLLDVERDWAPTAEGTALYIRPAIVATEPYLGVRPARAYQFFVIVSPVGAYAGVTARPWRIRVEERLARAASGGTGAAKTGGNYAASLLAAEHAHRDGLDQVLWLDSVEHRYLDEVGTMNIMAHLGGEVITPPLGGTILDGVVRDSAMTLLRAWGVPVVERPLAIDEVLAAQQRGHLHEVWGTGTAAGIAPIGMLDYRRRPYLVGDGDRGPLARRLQRALADIQRGRAPDVFGWMDVITTALSTCPEAMSS